MRFCPTVFLHLGVVWERSTAWASTCLIIEVVVVMIVLLGLLALVLGKGVVRGGRIEGHSAWWASFLSLWLIFDQEHPSGGPTTGADFTHLAW